MDVCFNLIGLDVHKAEGSVSLAEGRKRSEVRECQQYAIRTPALEQGKVKWSDRTLTVDRDLVAFSAKRKPIPKHHSGPVRQNRTPTYHFATRPLAAAPRSRTVRAQSRASRRTTPTTLRHSVGPPGTAHS